MTNVGDSLNMVFHSVTNMKNGGSLIDLALTSGASTAFPAITLDCAGLELSNAHKYSVTLGFRVRQYLDSDHSTAGSSDLVIDANVTVAAGVATVTFTAAPAPDNSRLPSGLSAGTCTVVASTGGFTVSVTRGVAANCHARYAYFVNTFEDVT